MASSLKNLSKHNPATIPNGEGFRIAIVVSEYHPEITFALRDGAIKTLLENGVQVEDIVVDYVPGAFELPFGAQVMYHAKMPDAIIVLGCVIKGDTEHDQYINSAVTNQIMMMSIEYQLPIVFGLLTTNNLQQAQDRAGGKHGNKGIECAIAALKMVDYTERYPDEMEDDNSFLN